MKLSISVMAHPSRSEFFPYLSKMLGDVPFSIDHLSQGEWENCKKAWRMHASDADWHVVIQDDAIVCENFIDRAIEVITKAREVIGSDNYICNFYYGYRRSAAKQAADALAKGYWINSAPKWGVAICLPVRLIEEMIKFGDEVKNDDWKTKDDARIGAFISTKKIPVYFPMPSIIDHRHGKSLVGDPGEKRSAYKFIDK